jgi:hypothetical protein
MRAQTEPDRLLEGSKAQSDAKLDERDVFNTGNMQRSALGQ